MTPVTHITVTKTFSFPFTVHSLLEPASRHMTKILSVLFYSHINSLPSRNYHFIIIFFIKSHVFTLSIIFSQMMNPPRRSSRLQNQSPQRDGNPVNCFVCMLQVCVNMVSATATPCFQNWVHHRCLHNHVQRANVCGLCRTPYPADFIANHRQAVLPLDDVDDTKCV